MASNQPMTGRDVIPAGIDVRTIRKPINQAFASVPIELIGEGAATSTDGRRMSFTVIPEDAFYIRLNNKTTVNGTIRYAWTAVNQDRDSGNWTNSVRAGNATTDDWAVELNNANLTVGTATRYPARVNPQTGRLTFFQGSGSGNETNGTFKGKDVLTMILGPWQDFADCEDDDGNSIVPPDPPVATDENCPPAYAWSGYKICGYQFKKVSTYQTVSEDPEDPNDPPIVGMGFWATELNGQSTSSWRRFHRSWWGWDTEEDSPLDANVGCAGVRFESPNLAALTCSCPQWLQDVRCIKLRIKFIADPGPPTDPSCDDCYEKLAGFFGTEETAILCNQDMGCLWQSNEGPAPFASATATYQNLYEIDPCFTGPEWFDPCDPCDGFATLAFSINDATTAAGGCAAAGNFYVGGRVPSFAALREFVEACAAGGSPEPIRLERITKAGPCANYVEWMELECCSCEESNLECGTTLDCGP